MLFHQFEDWREEVDSQVHTLWKIRISNGGSEFQLTATSAPVECFFFHRWKDCIAIQSLPASWNSTETPYAHTKYSLRSHEGSY